jgi:hypothetical protein
MIARNTNADLRRRHIWMDDDDWQWIHETFGPRNMKPSEVIRLILRKYRQGVEAKAAALAHRPAVEPHIDG